MVVSCFLVCLDVGLVGRVKTNSFPRGHSRPSRLHLLQPFLLMEADLAAGILRTTLFVPHSHWESNGSQSVQTIGSKINIFHPLQAFLLIQADPAAGILPLYFILHTSYLILKVFKLLAQKSTYLTSFLVFRLIDGDPQKSYLQSSWKRRWKSKLAHLNWFVLLQTVFVSAPGGGTKEDRSIYSIRLCVVLAIEETIHIHCYLVLPSPEWFVPNYIITWSSSSSQQCASSEWLVTMWGAPELVSGGCWHALVAPQTPPAPHLEPLTFKH